MANPLYDMLIGGPKQQAPQQPAIGNFQNPIQRMNYIMQAMQNPIAFVRQQIPDIPEQIINDPNQIIQYLQKTRGISDDQIRQIAMTIPRFR